MALQALLLTVGVKLFEKLAVPVLRPTRLKCIPQKNQLRFLKLAPTINVLASQWGQQNKYSSLPDCLISNMLDMIRGSEGLVDNIRGNTIYTRHGAVPAAHHPSRQSISLISFLLVSVFSRQVVVCENYDQISGHFR